MSKPKQTPVIEVSGISKKYKISHKLSNSAHLTIKESMVKWARKPLEIMGAAGGMSKEEFYALNDINFKVYPGEVVGIMGRNGSGKSTLFKILSRIAYPTEGRAVLRGKVASLLEVGTGFHPELTGRENVYFNGSVLGMKKAEIEEKFDSIVEFSEVERFLDTPIKYYSSGMKVRLAFSVAAHLNPEILIIDEVLAVGDVRFKKKSLERMQEIAAGGTTILFVSHIVNQIEKICTRGIVLNNGTLEFDGELQSAIDKYIEFNKVSAADTEPDDFRDKIDSGQLSVVPTLTLSQPKSKPPRFDYALLLKNASDVPLEDLRVAVNITNSKNFVLSNLNNGATGQLVASIEPGGQRTVRFVVNEALLMPGDYYLSVSVRSALDDKAMFRQDTFGSFSVKSYKKFDRQYALPEKGAGISPPVILDYRYEEVQND